MFSRFGLRFGMAVSYVLVSAIAVLLVEAVLLALMVPQIRAADRRAEQAQQRAAEAEIETNQIKVATVALQTATAVGGGASQAASRAPGLPDEALLAEAMAKGLGDHGPQRRAADPQAESGPELAQAIATTDGRVIVSIPDGFFARDSTLPAAAIGLLPRGGRTEEGGRAVSWATAPVELADPVGGPNRVIGIAYAVLLAPPKIEQPLGGQDGGTAADPNTRKQPGMLADAGIGSLITPGVIILILLLPVGGLFGLFSTRRLIRRIRRLADGTSAMADGDLKARIPVSGADEVSA